MTAAPQATAGEQSKGGDAPPKGSKDIAQARDRFTGALRGLLAGEAGGRDPAREEIVSALVSAGFDNSQVEVSIDTTPTGLEVAAMEAAVSLDGQCLVGQLRSGELSVTVLPVLASGHCFVGDQR